ncbi:MAG TPA: sigma-70 family RNA polymerase sigma factor [Chloroflexota bacterium]|nr:sigma-70 family RNA polymerase sigma factor [Chloroflexota bacterium]
MPATLQEMVERAKSGESAATIAVIEYFDSVIRPYSRRGERDDVRQEAAVCLITEIHAYDVARCGDPEKFLRNRLHARLSQYLRAERRRNIGQVPLARAPLDRLVTASPLHPRAPGPRLASALRRLSPAQRSVLYRLYWQGKKAMDIAHEDGTTYETIRAIHHRARADLLRALRDWPPPSR